SAMKSAVGASAASTDCQGSTLPTSVIRPSVTDPRSRLRRDKPCGDSACVVLIEVSICSSSLATAGEHPHHQADQQAYENDCRDREFGQHGERRLGPAFAALSDIGSRDFQP